ncbi:hypothetical protein [Methylotuvimicrobium alcaliphilum]|uniref:Uncharacterized protein n=1 Tax=Methylotuvimicrobium alcaliphilum (strain DSM 19304 / NCIMB 14124 / VKM B-2133 / 20Z) TaxID=1091494 RepID=G4SUZ0_META2|nr:hypothetical protein [Methylotuvimicrobium alcaliphilum]CCE24049.1 protein of unknown function [Methylotuvimicrobium alcaliphilum 20Z]
MKLAKNHPSQESQVIQMALNKAIANALEKKRKLGQYAVMWENNRVVYKGADAPDRHDDKQTT